MVNARNRARAATAGRAAQVWPEIVSRSLAAVFGGYAVTYCITAFLAVYLPLSPVNSVFAATVTAFVFYTAAAIYAFAARSHLRVWRDFALTGGVLAAAAFL